MNRTRPYRENRNNRWGRLFTSLLMAMAIAGVGTTSKGEAAGLLTPKNSNLPSLKIRDHRVTVVIEEGYGVTTVDQTFHNPHPQELEAIYSFPVPEKAAVAQFTYWINGKPVHGEILAKKKAREIYEEEKKAGRDTGLAEKNGYKTFEISVAPVRPGADAHIRLRYIQPTHSDSGMGRYLYPLEEGGVDDAKEAFWTANDEVAGHFSFNLTLRSSYPVEAMTLRGSLSTQAKQDSQGNWRISLDNGVSSTVQTTEEQEESTTEPPPPSKTTVAPFRLNQDIVAYWRQASGLPGAVDLTAFKTDKKKTGTFMLTFTPGDDLAPIKSGQDWVFVLDKSGSMKGKFLTLAEGVTRGLKKMRPQDRYRIITFDKGVEAISKYRINTMTKA
jgi:Ca-activated chloride channel homolog